MANSYTLTRAAVRSLRADHQQLRTELQNLEESRLRYNNRTPQRDDLLIAKAAGAVAARSGATAASGEFTVQAIDGAGVMTDTAKSHTVFNVGDSAISSGDYVPIERDYKSARWVCRAGGAGGGGATVDIAYVKAQEYWQHGGTLPSAGGATAWVSVKKCDQDGTNQTGAAFDCYLPSPPHMDPNVVVDQVIAAAEFEDQSDSATSWSAISDTSDLAVGSVKMMTGNLPTAAHGWAAMDGTQDDTKTATGTAINFTGRVPLDGTPGTAAGTVSPSTTTGSTTPDTVTTSSTGVSVNISGSSATTGSSETGIESTNSTSAGTVEVSNYVEVEGEDMNPTTVVEDITGGDDLSHSHGITDPGHTHTVTGTFTGTADAHTHTVPGDAHTHTIEQMATMTVQLVERIDNSNFA